MSKAFLVVGCTGSGKSTFVRNVMKKVPKKALLLHDVNGEFTDIQPYKDEEFEEFIERAGQVRNAVIVVEEATNFFDSQSTDKTLKRMLVGKRHRNNTIFLLFHSFADVPPYIYKKCTHVIIFKTNDSIEYVAKRYNDERLTAAFKAIKEAKWIDSGKKNPDTGEKIYYSPSVIFDIYKVEINEETKKE